MPRNFEMPDSIEKKERLNKFDRIYVLAHGEPDQPLSMDSKIRILAAMELAKNNKGSEIYFIGGGLPEEGVTTSMQMQEYFERINRSSKDKIANRTEVLDKSNNTAGNIEEILNSIEDSPHNKEMAVAVISNDYHINRIKALLDKYGVDAEALPAEDVMGIRSPHHKKFVEKYEKSLGYKEKEIVDKLMCLYLKIDPEQSLVKKFRTWSRKK